MNTTTDEYTTPKEITTENVWICQRHSSLIGSGSLVCRQRQGVQIQATRWGDAVYLESLRMPLTVACPLCPKKIFDWNLNTIKIFTILCHFSEGKVGRLQYKIIEKIQTWVGQQLMNQHKRSIIASLSNLLEHGIKIAQFFS